MALKKPQQATATSQHKPKTKYELWQETVHGYKQVDWKLFDRLERK